jgi:hypothetical protein
MWIQKLCDFFKHQRKSHAITFVILLFFYFISKSIIFFFTVNSKEILFFYLVLMFQVCLFFQIGLFLKLDYVNVTVSSAIGRNNQIKENGTLFWPNVKKNTSIIVFKMESFMAIY